MPAWDDEIQNLGGRSLIGILDGITDPRSPIPDPGDRLNTFEKLCPSLLQRASSHHWHSERLQRARRDQCIQWATAACRYDGFNVFQVREICNSRRMFADTQRG